MDLRHAVKLISDVLRMEYEIGDSAVIFTSSRDAEYKGTVERSEIEAATASLSDATLDSAETQLITKDRAEFLVDISDRRALLIARENFELHDEKQGYSYILGSSSLSFALYVADNIFSASPENEDRRWVPRVSLFQRPPENGSDVLSAFIKALRLHSLRISSPNTLSRKDFLALADAFYFHVAYNLDYAVVPQPTLHKMLQQRRIERLRKTNKETLDAPHRRYISALVRSYQLALSTESAMLSYLSYYHVAEYWFDDVFHNSIALKLQGKITDPAFSYKRLSDVRKLIDLVGKEIKQRDERVVIDEETALKLTLEKHVDINKLEDSIRLYDSTLLTYYTEEKVRFSDGDTVDLTVNDSNVIFKKLASRIYKTRNALVHGKAGPKKKFSPFQDDYVLEREVTLLRFVAEQIILSSSEV